MTRPSKLVSNLVRECARRRGNTRSDALVKATGAFGEGAAKDPALITEAVAHLTSRSLPPAGVAWLALTFGTGVERGADVELSIGALLSLLDEWLAALPAATEDEDEDEAAEQTAEQAELIEVLPSLCQAIVAHLARAPARRAALSNNRDFLARLAAAEAWSHGPAWVRQAVEKTSGELLVLHAPSRRGLRLRYSNVSNCFHLFSLLQTAIGTRLPGGREPEPFIAAVARDQAEGAITDVAWWHYAHADSRAPDISASIWGEGKVSNLPLIDGVRVIILWKPILGARSWDGGFFHPQLAALPPDAVVEGELSDAETAAWFAKLHFPDAAS